MSARACVRQCKCEYERVRACGWVGVCARARVCACACACACACVVKTRGLQVVFAGCGPLGRDSCSPAGNCGDDRGGQGNGQSAEALDSVDVQAARSDSRRRSSWLLPNWRELVHPESCEVYYWNEVTDETSGTSHELCFQEVGKR